MQQSIFVSYRRADTSGHAGRISDDLQRHFGVAVVFRDVDSISAGADFVEALNAAMQQARVCLVLIGDTWLSVCLADGRRRLDAPDDHVRREVEMALRQPGLLVVPVLVEGATMPTAEQLPDTLRGLARLHAVELSESRWDFDVERLVAVLRKAGVAPRRWSYARVVPGAVAVLLVAGLLAVWLGGRTSAPDPERFMGLWYLPNGSFWTVRQRGGVGLWVEETHYESRQVWKQGPAELSDDNVAVTLDLVFERVAFHYAYVLELTADGNTLLGDVSRSDRDDRQSVVLHRERL